MVKEYFKEYFTKKMKLFIFVAIFMLMAIGAYIAFGPQDVMSKKTADPSINRLLSDIRLKAAYTPEGNLKVFAIAPNNALKALTPESGNNIPEYDSMVIGASEAKMMIDEKLFSSPGDELNDLFGIDTKVEGVLKSTGTIADEFHFLSEEQYDKIDGKQDVLSIHFKDDAPKLFYVYEKDGQTPAIKLDEGNMNLFYEHISSGKIYYPLIIGYDEAKMMKEEGLFKNVGDTIDGFFGKDVIIVGIASKTDTALDMAHIVEKDFFEKKLVPENGVLL